jgi:SSS family solute:Na+ symporter
MLDNSLLLELVALGVYLVALLGIGITAARQVRTSVDFTLAGRDVHWLALLATTAATMVGGGMSIGFIALVYNIGIAGVFGTLGAYIGLIITGLWIAPKLRGLDLITVGDYFELKFGKLARLVAVAITINSMFACVVAQMVAMATITNTLIGVDYKVALVIGAAVTVFYATVGGLQAVIKTDILQFVILVGGFGIAAVMLVWQHGGMATMAQHVETGHFELTSEWSMTRVVTFSFTVLLGEMLAAPYVTRCFISKDAQGARWGIAGAGIFLLLFLPVTTLVLATAALADPSVNQAVLEAGGDAQVAFPTLMRTFHPIFSGVMIAAIVAAVMSSADSCLSSLATVAMEDVYRQLKPDANDHQLLRVARWTTFYAGVGAAVCAYYFRDIIQIIEFIYDFWGATIVLPFLVGIFFYSRQWIYATVSAMLVALTATICWRFVLDIPGDFSPALFGFVVAVVTLLITFPLTRHLPLGGMFTPGKGVKSEQDIDPAHKTET